MIVCYVAVSGPSIILWLAFRFQPLMKFILNFTESVTLTMLPGLEGALEMKSIGLGNGDCDKHQLMK